MDDFFSRFFEHLAGRLSGPMKFRLLLQPLTAIVLAVRSGLKDSKEDKPPYFWGLFTHPESRADMLRDGWKSIGRVYVLAIIIDVVYQFVVFRRIYPLETLWVAGILALFPYLLIRGPVNRIARRKR